MKNKKVPMRTCIGCRQTKPKSELIRIAAYEGEVNVDVTGKAKGRGVYICPDEKCLEKAKKSKALSRGLKVEVTEETAEKVWKEMAENAGKD